MLKKAFRVLLCAFLALLIVVTADLFMGESENRAVFLVMLVAFVALFICTVRPLLPGRLAKRPGKGRASDRRAQAARDRRAAGPAPIRQARPTVEAAPIQRPRPTVEAAPIQRPRPTVEAAPAAQLRPTVEAAPAAQLRPTVEAASTPRRRRAAGSHPAPQPSETPAPQPPSYGFVSFKVAGTTYDSDGVSRQSMLKKIKFGDPPFENAGASQVSLKRTTYKGRLAIEVRVNDYLIGYVPKERVEEIDAAIGRKDAGISAFEVLGGGNAKNGEPLLYGARVTVRYEE